MLARDPEFPFAELWLGRALLLSGRPDEAWPLLENKHWSYRGYLYAVTGRRAAAEALAAANPNDPAVRCSYTPVSVMRPRIRCARTGGRAALVARRHLDASSGDGGAAG